MNKLKYIDSIRGFGMLGILIVHCIYFGNNEKLTEDSVKLISSLGYTIQLFYMSSAFTLFLSMDNRYEHESRPLLNFFIRRFFRIAPMFYIAIGIYCWENALIGGAPFTFWNLISHVFFFHSVNPNWINTVVPGGWSVGIEMLFYCFVPFLYLKIKNAKHAFYFVLISLLIYNVFNMTLSNNMLIEDKTVWDAFLFFYLPAQLPAFALGILLYFLIRDGVNSLQLGPKKLMLIVIIFSIHFSGAISLLPIHLIYGLIFIFFIIALSRNEFKLLVNPFILHVGKVSYSMYLTHFLVIHALRHYDLLDYLPNISFLAGLANLLIRWIIVVTITLGIGSVGYYLVEQPMMNVGKKLIKCINLKYTS